jgi:hypothetical protein
MSLLESGELFAGDAAARALLEEPAAHLSTAACLTYVGISVGLVLMAGLMSGLTIGLMALDDMEMEVRAPSSAAADVCMLFARDQLLPSVAA